MIGEGELVIGECELVIGASGITVICDE